MNSPSALLFRSSKKVLKTHPEINYLLFWKMELFTSNIKKFQQTETPKRKP